MLKVNREKIKRAAKKPKFNPIQIIMLVITIGFFAITNTDWFSNLTSIWKFAAYGGFVLTILLLGNPLGKTEDLARSFMKIIFSSKDAEQKVVELQNLVVAICQQLGLYYEKERDKVCEE